MARTNKNELYGKLLKNEIANTAVEANLEVGNGEYLRAGEIQAYAKGLRKALELFGVCSGKQENTSDGLV